MDGGTAALAYSLLLSLIHKHLFRILSNKLSSAGGFILTYLVAVYAPIYVLLARIFPLAISVLVLFHMASIMMVISSRSRDSKAIIAMNMHVSTAISILLIIMQILVKI